jgi:eukaryotic-like serine/threonine-protein kinase
MDDPDWAAARSRVGRTLSGKWTLEDVLGVGGMAAVYRAVHRNGSRAAVKMLHPALGGDAELKERFLREGYAANRIQHDGVVKVLDDDVDAAENAVYLVMELLKGEPLDSRLERKGGRLPLSEALSIGYYTADALVAAHGAGILHRDIKPENLFLCADGRVKILDFGLARLVERSSTAMTREGSVLGTPAFMSPEQARGRWSEIDARADVFSLGATIFTLISGKNLHEASTPMDALVAAASRPARSLREVSPEVSAPIAQVIDRATAFSPAERFSDMATMREALAQASAELAAPQPVRLSLPDFSPAAMASTAVLDPAEQDAVMARVREITAARPEPSALPVAPTAPALSKPASRGWLLLLLFGAVVLVCVAAAVTWFVIRSR